MAWSAIQDAVDEATAFANDANTSAIGRSADSLTAADNQFAALAAAMGQADSLMAAENTQTAAQKSAEIANHAEQWKADSREGIEVQFDPQPFRPAPYWVEFVNAFPGAVWDTLWDGRAWDSFQGAFTQMLDVTLLGTTDFSGWFGPLYGNGESHHQGSVVGTFWGAANWTAFAWWYFTAPLYHYTTAAGAASINSSGVITAPVWASNIPPSIMLNPVTRFFTQLIVAGRIGPFNGSLINTGWWVAGIRVASEGFRHGLLPFTFVNNMPVLPLP